MLKNHLFANAKINLSLAIINQNSDGYHNLLSLVVPISIYDEITIEEAPQYRLNANINELIKDNTVKKVINYLQQYVGQNFHINLQKKIPIMAGFGGGSSDAVAVLKFLNTEYHLGFNEKFLNETSKLFGADCPFFISNKPAIVSGIGDIITPLEKNIIQSLKKYHLIIFKPPFNINTSEAYGKLRTCYQHLYISEIKANTKLNNLITSLENFSENLPLFNTFSDIVFEEHKELTNLQEKLQKFEASMMLSGSGSGCFCMTKNKEKVDEIIQLLKNSFKEKIFINKVNLV